MGGGEGTAQLPVPYPCLPFPWSGPFWNDIPATVPRIHLVSPLLLAFFPELSRRIQVGGMLRLCFRNWGICWHSWLESLSGLKEYLKLGLLV